MRKRRGKCSGRSNGSVLSCERLNGCVRRSSSDSWTCNEARGGGARPDGGEERCSGIHREQLRLAKVAREKRKQADVIVGAEELVRMQKEKRQRRVWQRRRELWKNLTIAGRRP